ncbi:uncharacterized protein MONBRDRAFT_37025 [Monosiga brevicollis MX1]|uniref:Glycosyltransferase 2-like domain-containing protein n=1 Tax=Monosiga brevicollis TaxID=81824 RepID=A9UZ41_MONBE|nr:uncharacterized protein MONBRDRAFT_37025 [Monosiga brevicollis MX1]EDQ89719.1 predicted protein [Monosiga brevicollis MX1]|eukprot:XP_001745748.1 hypothetical protein [Monosiga brevicollis MX1]
MRLRVGYSVLVAVVALALGFVLGRVWPVLLANSTNNGHTSLIDLGSVPREPAHARADSACALPAPRAQLTVPPPPPLRLYDVADATFIAAELLEEIQMPINVLLVTSAIGGPTANGGIATAFLGLARHLRESTYKNRDLFNVTILYAAHPWYAEGTAERWVAHFANLGINFIPLPGSDGDYYGPKLSKRAYRAYEWLRPRQDQFDVVSVPDFMGTGYYMQLAKHLGLAFQHLDFIVQCHSTIRWADELNRRPPRDHNTLAVYYQEEQSLSMADIRVSPSRYYLEWFNEPGRSYNVSGGRNLVMQNTLYPLPEIRPPQTITNARHFVFFSRLETRKGLFVFLDALQLLAKSLIGTPFTEPIDITFLGPDVSAQGQRASRHITAFMSQQTRFRYRIVDSLPSQQALQYISSSNAVTVMPTLGDNSPYVVLELLALGLPFITTQAGGGVELLKGQDVDKFVVEANCPDCLMAAMRLAHQGSITGFSFKVDPTKSRNDYVHLFAASGLRGRQKQHALNTQAQQAPSSFPNIFVGITSHDRPDTLLRVIDSLLNQEYPLQHLGIGIVDDKSELPEMPDVLRTGKAKLAKAGLRDHVVQIHEANTFVAQSRNEIFRMGQNYDWVCLMDDDDFAEPHMLKEFMSVAHHQPEVELIMALSNNFDINKAGHRVFSHTSLAIGNAFAHNFFINNYGKANFCIRPQVAARIGGHRIGEYTRSPFVDWAFLTRASLQGVQMALVPDPLYNYTKMSSGSIWYGMASAAEQYAGHMKILQDVWESVPMSHFIARVSYAIRHDIGDKGTQYSTPCSSEDSTCSVFMSLKARPTMSYMYTVIHSPM